MSNLPGHHPLRWRMWIMWWVTHSIVGGTGRVVFDVAFPFLVAPEAIPGLLAMGTVATVLGKLVSGPICTGLGAYRTGLIALGGSAVLLLGIGLGGATPLLPIVIAWPLFRALQTITWPSANTVCVAWFDKSEHGGAWGVMSTASRSGVILATSLIGVTALDISSRICFKIAGCAMGLYCVAMAVMFLERPAASRPMRTVAPAAVEASSGAVGAELRAAASNPMLWLAVLAQGMATPIAEFQSLLPLLLANDESLGPSAIAAGCDPSCLARASTPIL